MSQTGYLLNLGETPYLEAWELQRALAGAVSQDAIPDTVVMLEHPPVITLGRRTDGDEVHVPPGAAVEVVETDRGGKSTFHGSPPRKICSIGVHISRWVTTHGYALNVDLDPAPFTDWITACGLEDAAFTTMARELGRPVSVDEVRPAAAAALEDVFQLAFEELPADDGPGLWAQPTHAKLAASR